MKDIPKVGDVVVIESDSYEGEAYVSYIDYENLFAHEFYPIQCELSEGDLHQLDDFNHDQNMMRFNLKEIISIYRKEENAI